MKRFFFLAIFFPMLFSCANETSRLVLWTDCVDFVSYTELFNASQDKIKIVALYKDDLTGAMPPSKSEPHPDIVAGAFLRSGMQKKIFFSHRFDFRKERAFKGNFLSFLFGGGAVQGKAISASSEFQFARACFSHEQLRLRAKRFFFF